MDEFNLIQWVADKLGYQGEIDILWISLANALIIFILLSVVAIVAWSRIRKKGDDFEPSDRFSLTAIMEVFVERLLGVMQEIMGNRAEQFLPLIGTLFIYIFCCNLLGFIPGFMSPTTVIVTNFACALVVFFYYNYVGIRERGFFGYFRHFLGPVIWLAPLFLCIELMSHLVRPISLSVRLYGNMVGDHMVVGVFSHIAPFVVPIFFILLGVFVSFIQAFVFSILSTVYIAMAVNSR